MDQVHRQVSVILYLAENAQELIFVHIPKNYTGDNPLRKKNWPYHFFLGATPMIMPDMNKYKYTRNNDLVL
jgi:hypothetical protein